MEEDIKNEAGVQQCGKTVQATKAYITYYISTNHKGQN